MSPSNGPAWMLRTVIPSPAVDDRVDPRRGGAGEDVDLDAGGRQAPGELEHVDVHAPGVAGARLVQRRRVHADHRHPADGVCLGERHGVLLPGPATRARTAATAAFVPIPEIGAVSGAHGADRENEGSTRCPATIDEEIGTRASSRCRREEKARPGRTLAEIGGVDARTRRARLRRDQSRSRRRRRRRARGRTGTGARCRRRPRPAGGSGDATKIRRARKSLRTSSRPSAEEGDGEQHGSDLQERRRGGAAVGKEVGEHPDQTRRARPAIWVSLRRSNGVPEASTWRPMGPSVCHPRQAAGHPGRAESVRAQQEPAVPPS